MHERNDGNHGRNRILIVMFRSDLQHIRASIPVFIYINMEHISDTLDLLFLMVFEVKQLLFCSVAKIPFKSIFNFNKTSMLHSMYS